MHLRNVHPWLVPVKVKLNTTGTIPLKMFITRYQVRGGGGVELWKSYKIVSSQSAQNRHELVRIGYGQ